MTIDIFNPDPVVRISMYVTGAILLSLVILVIAAVWKILVKGSERGWKVLIPLLNSHALYKITWNKSVFWTDLILDISGSVLLGLSGGSLLSRYAASFAEAGLPSFDLQPYLFGSGTLLPPWCCLVAFILLTASGILHLIRTYKLSRAFDHGLGFFCGLLFFPVIFLLILAFDKHQYYVGPNRTVTVEQMKRIR